MMWINKICDAGCIEKWYVKIVIIVFPSLFFWRKLIIVFPCVKMTFL